jgi:hypothetical protein
MLSVYLDQAKWIDLSRARLGLAEGAPFVEALDVARHALALGLVRFPLSRGHYIETWRVSDPDRRRRLARTMIELSEAFTLASPPDLCDNELDAVISRISGKPPARPPWPPFGWGFLHAAGEISDMPRSQIDLDLEFEHLARRPDGYLAHGGGHRDFADVYRQGEQGLRDLLAGQELKGKPRELREAIVPVSAVAEIHENIRWALDRAGLPADALGPISSARPDLPERQVTETLRALLPLARPFIAELPTRDAALRLRTLRHQNPATCWESNDMVDIAYLACAAVHCDLVVTERQWVHELNRSGLLQEHGTAAIHNVGDLPSALARLLDGGEGRSGKA